MISFFVYFIMSVGLDTSATASSQVDITSISGSTIGSTFVDHGCIFAFGLIL